MKLNPTWWSNMIAERLDGTEPLEVIERHKDRYRKAVILAERTGGVWWDAACGDGYAVDLIPADVLLGFDKDPPAWGLRTDLSQPGWSAAAFAPPDVVLSIETLEHLNRVGQEAFVGEVSARLNPDGVFVLACPIGAGVNPANPWHLHEPTEPELYELLWRHFREVWVGIEDYDSTSGPAVQAYATARRPRC